ncbi:GAF domain-containing sensor histidine kinase [Mucilaginibacter sp.]|uniref:GAF domain-containing sensor histidine kinase n=1 Tax=Mucilaginibacter sp. TaxID=1882438 RepID=UPI003B00721B
MKKPSLPKNETERLNALNSYAILDTSYEKSFDEITELASQICGTPIALISLVDDKRQWFKSNYGLKIRETDKDYAFCAHAILNPLEVMVVPDAMQDERFKNNPLATGNPHVIFYVGVPLVNNEGYPLGTLCVIDHQPKNISDEKISALKVLAKQVINQLELRKKTAELDRSVTELQESHQYLERFALIASHDIKTPLTSIMLSAQMFKVKYSGLMDDKANYFLDTINHSSKKLLGFLNNMLDYSKANTVLTKRKDRIYVNDLLLHILKLLCIPENIHVEIPKQAVYVKTSLIALEQIFINLLHYAAKNTDKNSINIRIDFEEDQQFYHFKIFDNGRGIGPEVLKNIFKPLDFTKAETSPEDNKAKIGLSTVKNLIESLGGELKLNSVLNEGTTCEFTILK